jgi:PPM family protein phosphatase
MKKGTLFDYIEAVAKSDVGSVRSENQDFFGVVKSENFQAFFVADGMGGARGGQLAASKTVEFLGNSLKELPHEPTLDDLRFLTEKTNKDVFNLGCNSPDLRGMGTTLVGIAFSRSHVLMVNVGDSRIYRLRNEKLYQLTEDHTVWNDLVRNGSIPPTGEFAEDISHMLTRSIGPSNDVEVDVHYIGVEAGDAFLLCSDGLYNMINEGEIVQSLQLSSASKAIDSLITLANKGGGKDNITALVIKIKKSACDVFPTCTEQLSGLRECDLSKTKPAVQSLGEQLVRDLEEDKNHSETSAGNSKKSIVQTITIAVSGLFLASIITLFVGFGGSQPWIQELGSFIRIKAADGAVVQKDLVSKEDRSLTVAKILAPPISEVSEKPLRKAKKGRENRKYRVAKNTLVEPTHAIEIAEQEEQESIKSVSAPEANGSQINETVTAIDVVTIDWQEKFDREIKNKFYSLEEKQFFNNLVQNVFNPSSVKQFFANVKRWKDLKNVMIALRENGITILSQKKVEIEKKVQLVIMSRAKVQPSAVTSKSSVQLDRTLETLDMEIFNLLVRKRILSTMRDLINALETVDLLLPSSGNDGELKRVSDVLKNSLIKNSTIQSNE